MDRAALEQFVRDRGLDYLTDAIIDREIDLAAVEVTLLDVWPWRLTSQSGVSPLTVPRLGPIDAVLDDDSDLPLTPERQSEAEERGSDLAARNPAGIYIVSAGTVIAYPAGKNLTVRHFQKRYWTTGTGVSAASDADTPLAPEEFHEMIGLLAASRCHALEGRMDGAQQLRLQANALLEPLQDLHLRRDGDEAEAIGSSEGW